MEVSDRRKGVGHLVLRNKGYTVSDCTAEAMKAIIMVRNHASFADIRDEIKDENLFDAVEVLLNSKCGRMGIWLIFDL